jgi:hypothetical protein
LVNRFFFGFIFICLYFVYSLVLAFKGIHAAFGGFSCQMEPLMIKIIIALCA